MPANPDLPYDRPRERVMLAFAEAVDAWSELEWELLMLFAAILYPAAWQTTASVFHSTIGFRAQLGMIKAAASARLEGDLAVACDRLIERAKSRGSKRNNIIHGRWRAEERRGSRGQPCSSLFRDYWPDNPIGSTPQTLREAEALRGKNRFYLKDLETAAAEFRALAHEVFVLQAERVTPAVIDIWQRDHART